MPPRLFGTLRFSGLNIDYRVTTIPPNNAQGLVQVSEELQQSRYPLWVSSSALKFDENEKILKQATFPCFHNISDKRE